MSALKLHWHEADRFMFQLEVLLVVRFACVLSRRFWKPRHEYSLKVSASQIVMYYSPMPGHAASAAAVTTCNFVAVCIT
jgi:hypothetical protein